MAEERLSVYRAWRSIKRRESSLLYNALRSIYEDSVFVAEIARLWPALPLLANLRCGLWYSPRFDGAAYFKSTDGHAGNWAFSTARLNLHVALLAGQRGGCIIVDSTRKGKRFPDSMSKTIPIWACVLNRAIERAWWRNSRQNQGRGREPELNISSNLASEMSHVSAEWDSSLHLPLWVPDSEKESIKGYLEEWTKQLEACGADIDSIASSLRKPLRPLWISQNTLIWLNEVPEHDSWDFTPVILVSASATNGTIQQRTSSEFSWHYISGAGDDEESWARGLSPELFWKNAFDLIDCGPDLCNQKVAEIVEKERVYCAQRGEFSPQVTTKSKLSMNSPVSHTLVNISCQPMDYEFLTDSRSIGSFKEDQPLSWIGSTNLAVASTSYVASTEIDVDCILDCDSKLNSFSFLSSDACVHLPIVASKMDRFSVIKNLPAAIDFAKSNLSRGKKVVVCCHNGEDISVCVCLAIFTTLFDERGAFDGGKSFLHSSITKLDLRRRLVFICKYAINARPSRGNLKQVFGFVSQEKGSWVGVEHADDCV